ncbi:MAG TPA: hypothetical protein PK358_02590 [Spirochaetota bacterium]|nr:hypothetical protein [Spirochaetota bacterium]HPJ33694.1 hypothetical protein [Spirochaetota bacterium]
MKIKITFAVSLILVVLSLSAQQGKGRVYYFYADNCSSCKQAQAYYKKPAGLKDGGAWTFNGTKFIAYRIVDSNNRILKNNIAKLNSLCDAITRRKGDSNFVYYRRDIYEYYKNRGLPYFRKEEKYSRKDEPFPTPVFVIGNRVVLGFNQVIIQQSINAMK